MIQKHCVFLPISHCNTLKLLGFAGVLFAMADFSSLPRLSVGVRSRLIAGQFTTVYLFLFNYAFVPLDVCFGLLSC